MTYHSDTNDGWSAFCIAILCYLSPDEAFERLAGGRKNRKWTREDMQKIKALRQDGTKWKDIADQFCVDKGKLMKIYSYYKKKGMV